MHYYIYPKGLIGQTVGQMIEYCKDFSDFNGVTYSFVDDFKEGITLKEQAEIIKQRVDSKEAKVVIALFQGIKETPERLKKLKNNLAKYGILECLEAPFVEELAKKVCIKAKDEVAVFAGGGGI